MAESTLSELRERRELLNAQHAEEQDYDDPNQEDTLEKLIAADERIVECEEKIKLVDA